MEWKTKIVVGIVMLVVIVIAVGVFVIPATGGEMELSEDDEETISYVNTEPLVGGPNVVGAEMDCSSGIVTITAKYIEDTELNDSSLGIVLLYSNTTSEAPVLVDCAPSVIKVGESMTCRLVGFGEGDGKIKILSEEVSGSTIEC